MQWWKYTIYTTNGNRIANILTINDNGTINEY